MAFILVIPEKLGREQREWWMSLADELRIAAKKMKQQKIEQKQKKTVGRRSSGDGGRSRTSDWKREDEIIAYYLYRSESSKFLRENYSLKRKISARAMSLKINTFSALDRGGSSESKGVSEQVLGIYKEFRSIDIKEFQKIVISILRGEYNPSASDADTVETVIIR